MNQGMPAETERASKPLNQQDADQQSNGKKIYAAWLQNQCVYSSLQFSNLSSFS
jgi:hypothetical protein